MNRDLLNSASVSKTAIVLNFLSVYIVWGSTYLAIKYAVASFPPLLMAATRFFVAGLLMMIIGKLRNEVKLQSQDQRLAAMSGMLLVLANGFVCIAEMSLPSGFVAIVIGMTPICVMILNWFFFEKVKPSLLQFLGILISLLGIILLTKNDSANIESSSAINIFLLVLAALSWAAGSIMQRGSGKVPNIFSYSGFQLVIGAIMIGAIGAVMGEIGQIEVSQINSLGIFSLLYLIIFGSTISFSSYIWISRHVDPQKVATYAVVNPVVAVWLGWAIADETLNIRTVLYSILVIVGLFFVLFKKGVPLREASLSE